MKRQYGAGIKKKSYTRRYTKAKRFGAVPRPLVQYPSGFPKQMMMTHKYVYSSTQVFTGPNLDCLYVPIGVNCLFDPYLSLGGAQPLYFDQMTTLYNHYTVIKSRFKASVVPNTVDPYVGGVYIDDDGSPISRRLENLMEQPSAYSKTSHRDVETLVLYKNWDCKSVFGPNPLDNDKLQGNVNANPEEFQAFMLFFRPTDSSVVSMTFSFTIEVEYDTIWNEIKQSTSS